MEVTPCQSGFIDFMKLIRHIRLIRAALTSLKKRKVGMEVTPSSAATSPRRSTCHAAHGRYNGDCQGGGARRVWSPITVGMETQSLGPKTRRKRLIGAQH